MTFRAVIPALLLAFLAHDGTAFQTLPAACTSWNHHPSRGSSETKAQRHMPLSALRMLDQAAVTKNLETIADGNMPSKPAATLYKALVKRSGALSAAVECSRTADDGELLSTPAAVDLRQLGMKLRRGKAAAILVDCSTAAGKDDCEIMVKEQQSAKGSFPGPLPVVRSGAVASKDDIAEAKAMGVNGVLLSSCDEALIKACLVLGLEPVASATSAEDIEQAVAAGAKIIACEAAVRGDVPKDVGAVGLLPSRKQDPAEIFKVRDSEKDDAPTPQVIEDLFGLKEAKFNAVFAMDTCKSASSRLDVAYSAWLLEEMLSKKSGKFAKMAKMPSLGMGNPLANPDGILYEAQ